MSTAKVRCHWCGEDPLYQAYHDQEWGVPVYDDRKLFEFLLLEGVQAGLSWLTVLRKRENYREAFADFDYHKIARFDEKKVEQLLQNSGIIRNRRKIVAAITNARMFLEIQKEFGSFSAYNWSFVGGKPLIHYYQKHADIPPTSSESHAYSQDLKKRGFTFVGPTITYAHMQACGMVNDHIVGCFRHGEVNRP